VIGPGGCGGHTCGHHGHNTQVLDGLDSVGHLAHDIPHRTHCAELLHWYGYTPRGESATGEVHEAHRAGGDKRGEEAAQVPLPLPGPHVSR